MGRRRDLTLDAIQTAALADADHQAAAIRAAAAAQAERALADARARAAALVSAQRAAAERLAEARERERLADARARARGLVLQAQRTVLDDAVAAARSAARELPEDPRFALLLDRLAARARAQLEPAGPVQIVAAPDGGLVARAGSVELDYSLDAQLRRCLQALGPELEALWR